MWKLCRKSYCQIFPDQCLPESAVSGLEKTGLFLWSGFERSLFVTPWQNIVWRDSTSFPYYQSRHLQSQQRLQRHTATAITHGSKVVTHIPILGSRRKEENLLVYFESTCLYTTTPPKMTQSVTSYSSWSLVFKWHHIYYNPDQNNRTITGHETKSAQKRPHTALVSKWPNSMAISLNRDVSAGGDTMWSRWTKVKGKILFEKDTTLC